jgi:fructose-1,6-bisphosphatase/inositol monophosphatase family enzyme
MENQKYIDILISLEPAFRQAGLLAVEMQKTAKQKNKFSTGVAGIDIVTEADMAVQEFILSKMAETKLAECQIIAEEDTPAVKKFLGNNNLILTLDPIDGTLLYAAGKNYFLTIITLRDKNKVLYSFVNYPALNWSRRVVDGNVYDFGEMPDIKTKHGLDLDKTIAYTVKPPKIIDQKIYQELIDQGYKFVKAFDISEEAGAGTLFFLNKVAGYYLETPNPYDGTILHFYGKAKNFKTYSTLDISVLNPSDHGPHHVGWYVILKK